MPRRTNLLMTVASEVPQEPRSQIRFLCHARLKIIMPRLPVASWHAYRGIGLLCHGWPWLKVLVGHACMPACIRVCMHTRMPNCMHTLCSFVYLCGVVSFDSHCSQPRASESPRTKMQTRIRTKIKRTRTAGCVSCRITSSALLTKCRPWKHRFPKS